MRTTVAREAYFLDYARKVRARSSIPVLLTGGLRTAAVMEQVLGEGVASAVGLARPLIVEPDLPARLLSGQADAARPVEVSVGIRLLDSMAQSIWYQQQIDRMGRGLDPAPELSRWGAMLAGFFANYMFRPLDLLRRGSYAPAISAPASTAP